MKKLLVATLLCGCVVGSAMAEGLYVGVKAGQGNIGFANVTNNSQSATGIYAGVRLNEGVAIEGEYTNLGGFDTVSRINKGSALGISVVSTMQLAPQFSLLAKLGVAQTILTATAQPGWILVGSTSAKNTGMTFGFGAQMDVTPDVSLRGGYDTYLVGDANTNTASASVLSIGALLRF